MPITTKAPSTKTQSLDGLLLCANSMAADR